MSDNQQDRPDAAAEGDEQAPTEEPTSHKKWFVAVAAVTALSVGLAAIGLAASSNEETAKSAAVTPAEVGAIKVEALVADNIENKVIGSVAAVGAGFAVKLGLEAGLSFFGYETQEEKTTEQLKEINGRLDALSNQLTEINSHLDVMSEQIASVGSLVLEGNFQARSNQVDTAIGDIDNIYAAYKALLCAKGVEAQQQQGIESTGSLYNKDNCSDPGGVKTYEDLFSKKYEAATSSRFQLLHNQVMPAVGSRSILTDFVSVYMGDRKYFTFKDSIVLRNYYTNIAEYAALDAYLQSEYYVMKGQKVDAENVLSTWYNNKRAEQAVIPPMLPQGFLLMLPNGVGPVGDYPSLMFTAPTWMGLQVPANLPNNNSVSTVQDTPLPSSTQANAFSWNPSIDNTSVSSRVSQSQKEVKTRVNRVSMASPHKVGDICGKKTDAAGKLVIYGCVEGTEGYRRAMDTWSQWGKGAGWSLPSSASLKSLWDIVKPLAFADSPDGEARSAGGFGVYAKLPYLASGTGCSASGNARTVATAGAWCVVGDSTGTGYPSVWTAETQNVLTGSEMRENNYPYVDFTLKCEGGWTAHKKFNLISGAAETVGPYTTSPAPPSDGFWGDGPAIDPSWADQAEPVGPVATNEDEKCIFGSLIKASKSSNSRLPSEAGNQKVGLLVNRSLTTAKGDDYMAQNAMSTQWPVIQPTGPSNLGTFFPDPSTALVTWQFPLTDGGAPITSYKVTASPAAGGGTAISCPIVYRQPDYPSFEARCAGLTAGARYSFVVTATNSELLSGSAAITGPAAAPATATTVPPTTAVPAVSSTTTTAAPAASTTTAAGSTRDASKNVEAESFNGQCSDCSGVTIKPNDGFTSGGYIGAISTGDWVRFEGVNTPAGSDAKFAVRVASGSSTTGTIELRLDSPTGPVAASAPVSNTGGWHTWATLTAAKQSTLGTRNVYLVFKSGQSGDFVNVDWFKFTG